ncbi:MAG: electron transport complex subunit RsxC [Candidatus Dactylopiibacterium carminicum]|uniref:Ion-translocating oxidoreductase complex subunit C n=1 Tax=Candidatus Dactylopiibacterium carminicum TaxID=857335 RepID=A0A272EVG1_9RHOO|nr:electron transport complex subunit RsxC [Candidatus Dactylopiibacterium carminicum]KAF7598176.1 electron transport complex subunit RsxC [Candidatus Dactylopiibacterium carminicum]PAS94101.1 MAG: electron transport complex subunit RsxC [Candidatus Dactylopiibacterium carminicum]PAS98135.1 MAG: electron transport complex subunit RsxC [Candidatus Dactylopiibacterium carminicum]
MNALRKLFSFNGGVKPATHKAESTRSPIVPVKDIPLPPALVLPLHQSVGGTPRPTVKIGQHVRRGERIGAADGYFSSAVHASTSGTVVAIEPRTMAHTSGLAMLSVVIAPDGRDEWADLTPPDWRNMPGEAVREYLRDAGIVGMGGAVFPSHMKLVAGRQTAMKTLVINGAECEPFITCDDMLMRGYASEILAGVLIMRQLLGAAEALVGIEDNKPEAIAAMQTACAALNDDAIQIVPVPTRYPAGGAKQLIRVLTGIEVPHGQRSTDFGVQCFNVATARAIHEALDYGRPLTTRVLTVAGNVANPRNYEIRLGTPMDFVTRQAGLGPDTDSLIMGGPMMGLRMPALDVPVVKATNCIIAGSPALFPPPPPEMPCIRCGECARACPTDLQPFEMYWHSRAKNFGKVQEYHLFDCIECGCCAYVCPSHIPLVDYYRFSKTEIWDRERQKESADQARERFEARNERIEREKREKAEKLAARTAAGRTAAAAGNTAPPATGNDDAAKKALIEAAMARAKAKKEAAAEGNIDAVPAEKTTQAGMSAEDKQALIDAALAKAKARREVADTGSPSPESAPETKPAKKELSSEEKQALVDAALAKAKARREAAGSVTAAPATTDTPAAPAEDNTRSPAEAAIAKAKAARAAGQTATEKPAKKELSPEEKQASDRCGPGPCSGPESGE